MPIRWTPENDRILLLKILETHAISLNYSGVSAAWPAEDNERPTPRAISERIFRLRQMAGGKPSASAAATPTPTKAKLTTPGSRGGARSRGSSSAKQAGTKRRNNVKSEDDSESDFPLKRIKKTSNEVTMADLSALEAATPSKRSRKPAERFSMTACLDSGSDSKDLSYSSIDDEFVPDEVPALASIEPDMDPLSEDA
ncbi:hypothetical protein BGW36DRAFT_426041 [Talaromyces proteolyticus]|uniref:Uncharacterized protein n=1 Tax=Talaromyces proteolyticus TaxID=1131652 RepID=A0AAD4KQL4_9EURO|nr:uncharacterized protein BGW36DRAFT_426041 [Talaromyces proteolyticus]KAH8698329.1 hypothetical protein BGW36DRAFT_426041 [Talaromyces proteolyticus]